jgi:microcystin-dependent protein
MSYFSGIDQRIRNQTFFNNSNTITQSLTETNLTLLANLEYVQNWVGNIIGNYLTVNNPTFTGTLSTVSGNVSLPTLTATSANLTTGNLTTANITTANITGGAITDLNVSSTGYIEELTVPSIQGETNFAISPVITFPSYGSFPVEVRQIGQLKMMIPNGSVANYLECNGQSVSTTTYADLFAVIGYNYGGSGGNFNVPNMQSYFPVGANAITSGVASSNLASGNGLNGLSNQQYKTFNFQNNVAPIPPVMAEAPSHSHALLMSNSVDSTITPIGVQQYLYSSNFNGIETTNTGSGIAPTYDIVSTAQGVNVCMPYVAVVFWICYQ